MQPSKLKALHTYRTYFPDPPGGLQEAIRQIAGATKDYGVENTIFTLSPTPNPPEIAAHEGRVIRRKSWGAPASCDIGGPAAFKAFSHLTRDNDVLHYFYPWPFADVLREVTRPDRPQVMTYISDVVRQQLLGHAYAPLMWRSLRSMQLIVANCSAYAQTSPILSHPSIRDKVRVIPLGIDEHSYPQQEDDTILPRLGVADEEPFFLFIGVLRYYKGLEFLLRAATQVQAKIIVCGSGPEGERLQKLKDELGLDNVIFSGQVTDEEKIALLKHCQALVLPSHLRSEAYGMVLVEAAMFGKPMISCEIGTGTSFINAHEETGIVVPPANEEHLAQAMNTLLHEQELAKKMGQTARLRYETLFSGPALGKAYASLFAELLHGF